MSRSRGAESLPSAPARHRKAVAARVVRDAMPLSARSYRRRASPTPGADERERRRLPLPRRADGFGQERGRAGDRRRARAAPAVEIVSVDSALVYRGMDIGTAKPSAGRARRRAAPPDRHRRPGRALLGGALRRRRRRGDRRRSARAAALPLLVGGTMLYFKALFDGLDALPAADPAVRAELDASAPRAGWPALHAELAARRPGHRGAPGARTTASASSARSRSTASAAGRCRRLHSRAATAARRR